MQKEKGVIIEEINMYEDMPNRHVQDLLMQLLTATSRQGGMSPGRRKILSP